MQSISTVALLAGVNPLLALLPLFGVPSAWVTGKGETWMVDLVDRQAEPNRVLRLHFELMTQPRPAKEVRIFGLADELVRRRRALFDELEQERWAIGVRRVVLSTATWFLFAAGFVAAIVVCV